MVITVVLLCLVGLYIFKLNVNAEIIKENCKTDSDAVNVKNGQKVFYKTKISVILLIVGLISLALCLICNFTDLGNKIIDYFSYDFYEAKDFNINYYFIPVYIFVIREIIVQVKIGDFLYKYFNVKEPELEENLLKMILYKKKPEEKSTIASSENNQVENTQNKNKES